MELRTICPPSHGAVWILGSKGEMPTDSKRCQTRSHRRSPRPEARPVLCRETAGNDRGVKGPNGEQIVGSFAFRPRCNLGLEQARGRSDRTVGKPSAWNNSRSSLIALLRHLGPDQAFLTVIAQGGR